MARRKRNRRNHEVVLLERSGRYDFDASGPMLADTDENSPVELAADGKTKLPRVRMTAYNGGPVNGKFYHPFTIDISGVKNKQQIPLLYKHDDEIGHSTSVRKKLNSIEILGVLSVPSDDARKVAGASANGFKYQASVGIDVEVLAFVQRGASASVNGRTVKGPHYIARKSTLLESSVLPNGADGTTSSRIEQDGVRQMKNKKFKAYLAATEQLEVSDFNELDANAQIELYENFMALEDSDENSDGPTGGKTNLQAGGDDEKGGKGSKSGDDGGGAGSGVPVVLGGGNEVDVVQLTSEIAKSVTESITKKLNAEREQERAILTLTADHPEIRKLALENKWPEDKIKDQIELAALRSDRYEQLGIHTPDRSMKPNEQKQLLEARVSLALGRSEDDVAEQFKGQEKVVELAVEQGDIGLKELIILSLAQDGITGLSAFTDERTIFKKIEQNWSSISLPNMLESVCRRELEETWRLEPPEAEQILPWRSHRDFRPQERFRLEGGESWKRGNADGKFEQTSFGKEVAYSGDLDTFGQMLLVDRKNVVNDDMGAIEEMLAFMMEMGRCLVDDMFTGTLVDTSANGFWKTSGADQNVYTGTDLTEDGLNTAFDKFRKKQIVKDKKSKTRTLDPTHIMYPCDMEKKADDLFDNQYRPGDAGLQKNRFYKAKGKTLVQSNRLNDALTDNGLPTKTWFLFNMDRKYLPFYIATLKGKRRPTVETVKPPTGCLGIGWMAFWDVKVNTRERCGAVKFTAP